MSTGPPTRNGKSFKNISIKSLYSFRKFLIDNSSLVILAILIIISANITGSFLTINNIVNILRQQSTYMFVSLGVMMVVMTGGIDLSISSIVAVGSIMVAVVLTIWGLNSWIGLILAIILPVLCGAAFGALSGYFISTWRNMKPFIVTIATGGIASGIAYIITEGSPIRLDVKANPMSAVLVKFAQSYDPVLKLPLMAYLALLFVIIFYLMMKYTKFGRLVVATGSNQDAVRLAGISVRKYKAAAYIISGALAGFAGVLLAARSSMATAQTASDNYGITAISAVIIGGVSLQGGRGAVPLVVIGVFVMAIITNIMDLLSIAAYPQLVVQGLVVILAVLLRSISDKQSDKMSAR